MGKGRTDWKFKRHQSKETTVLKVRRLWPRMEEESVKNPDREQKTKTLGKVVRGFAKLPIGRRGGGKEVKKTRRRKIEEAESHFTKHGGPEKTLDSETWWKKKKN